MKTPAKKIGFALRRRVVMTLAFAVAAAGTALIPKCARAGAGRVRR